MAEIRLDHVTRRFGSAVAVDDLSLDVDDGEFLVLLGPSGCGKSTVLRLIAGLEAPDEGTVWIGGAEVTDIEARRRDVAMVFQSYALYPHLDVGRNIEFSLVHHVDDKGERKRRVAAAAEALGLTGLLRRKPGQLSGGQRQRVALARAIVREPVAFLMDEPLSNLDATLRAETRAELVALHRRLGATIVFVTHDQVEAMTMADRVAILVDGRLQQVGTPDDIFDRPANRFVARFVGIPPMNTWPGRIDAAGLHVGGVRIAPAPSGIPTGAVTIGVRPEALTPTTFDTPCALAVEVTLVESLGHERLVHGTLAGLATDAVEGTVDDGSTIVRAGHRIDVPRQGVLHVVADPAELHFFDAVTGEAL